MTKNADGSVTYGEFNGTRVTLRDFNGKQYVDIRKWVDGNIATKKGITIHVDMLGDCISLLEKVEQSLVKKA